MSLVTKNPDIESQQSPAERLKDIFAHALNKHGYDAQPGDIRVSSFKYQVSKETRLEVCRLAGLTRKDAQPGYTTRVEIQQPPLKEDFMTALHQAAMEASGIACTYDANSVDFRHSLEHVAEEFDAERFEEAIEEALAQPLSSHG